MYLACSSLSSVGWIGQKEGSAGEADSKWSPPNTCEAIRVVKICLYYKWIWQILYCTIAFHLFAIKHPRDPSQNYCHTLYPSPLQIKSSQAVQPSSGISLRPGTQSSFVFRRLSDKSPNSRKWFIDIFSLIHRYTILAYAKINWHLCVCTYTMI